MLGKIKRYCCSTIVLVLVMFPFRCFSRLQFKVFVLFLRNIFLIKMAVCENILNIPSHIFDINEYLIKTVRVSIFYLYCFYDY